MGITKASVADIASGKFIVPRPGPARRRAGRRGGCTSSPRSNARHRRRALRLDLRPDSKMTNANVANVVAMANDRRHDRAIQGRRRRKILVTPKTVGSVVTRPSDRSELKPGAPIFRRHAAGSPTARLARARQRRAARPGCRRCSMSASIRGGSSMAINFSVNGRPVTSAAPEGTAAPLGAAAKNSSSPEPSTAAAPGVRARSGPLVQHIEGGRTFPA